MQDRVPRFLQCALVLLCSLSPVTALAAAYTYDLSQTPTAAYARMGNPVVVVVRTAQSPNTPVSGVDVTFSAVEGRFIGGVGSTHTLKTDSEGRAATLWFWEYDKDISDGAYWPVRIFAGPPGSPQAQVELHVQPLAKAPAPARETIQRSCTDPSQDDNEVGNPFESRASMTPDGVGIYVGQKQALVFPPPTTTSTAPNAGMPATGKPAAAGIKSPWKSAFSLW